MRHLMNDSCRSDQLPELRVGTTVDIKSPYQDFDAQLGDHARDKLLLGFT